MKELKCQVCGGSAMPVYLRVWVTSQKDGKDHLQFVNFGTLCDSPECAAIVLDGDVYRKVQTNPTERPRIELSPMPSAESRLAALRAGEESRKNLGSSKPRIVISERRPAMK